MKNIIDIIIPSFNNQEYLQPCLESLLNNTAHVHLLHIYVVNNGDSNACDWITDPRITVIQTGGKNLGWEGGLKLALKQCKAEYVMFLNDDTYFPATSRFWITNLLQVFKLPNVGAVGPESNNVTSIQNMFVITNWHLVNVPFLIGFCWLMKRSVLEKVGGINVKLPGGDDLDLSIRLKDAGYDLFIAKNVFVYHFGEITGNKLYKDWNSIERHEKVKKSLIKKYSKKRWDKLNDIEGEVSKTVFKIDPGLEVEVIKKHIKPIGNILEIGCGGTKTFEESIGVDIVPKGKIVQQFYDETISVADITADVSKPLPIKDNSYDILIARNILEHMIDPIKAFQYWIKVLKKGGKFVIVVPNEDKIKSIPVNPEHVHAWTKDSLKTFLEIIPSVKILKIAYIKNWINFIAIGEKT